MYWTEERVVEAYRAFYAQHGRYPKLRDLSSEGLPGHETITRVCGSHTNAQVLAFDDYNPQSGSPTDRKDQDTEEVIRQLRRGRSLQQLGRERGISGQALGRRVKRYHQRKAITEGSSP